LIGSFTLIKILSGQPEPGTPDGWREAFAGYFPFPRRERLTKKDFISHLHVFYFPRTEFRCRLKIEDKRFMEKVMNNGLDREFCLGNEEHSFLVSFN